MTSERKAAANRRNAQHSTGPRTAEGKRIASQNAVTMGFFSRTVLLPHEDASALQMLQDGLVAQFRPVGMLEEWFVARMVSCLWRLRRVQLAEAGVFAQDCSDELARAAAPGARSEGELLGAALVNHGYHLPQFATLGRAEAALGREFYRALHELQRLQATRRGEAVAPPAAVDVTVCGPDEAPATRSAAEGSMSGEGVTSAIILPPEGVRAAADPPPGEDGEDPKGAAVEGEATGADSGIVRNAAIAEGVDPQARHRAAAQPRAPIALRETDPLSWLLSGPGRDRPGRPGWVSDRTERRSPCGRRARPRVSGMSTPRPHPLAVEATQEDERRGTGDDQGAALGARSVRGTRRRPRQHRSRGATRRASAVGEAGTPPAVILQNEPTADEAAPLQHSGLAAPPPLADGGDLPPAAAPAGGSPDVAAKVPVGPGRRGSDASWPIYIATRPIEIGRLRLQVGDPFPIQDKQVIRGYGRALGVPDADRRPFHELSYVAVRGSPA